jgi:hypothetical protein
MGRRIACTLVGILIAASPSSTCVRPTIRHGPALVPIPNRAIEIPAEVDCSTPMVWDLVDGSWTFFAIASWGGLPVLLHGPQLDRLQRDGPITMVRHPGHASGWKPSCQTTTGTWYGYYHHEVPAEMCGETRSDDLTSARRDRATMASPGKTGSHSRRAARQRWMRIVESLSARWASAIPASSSTRIIANCTVYFSPKTARYRDRAQGVANARLAWARSRCPDGEARRPAGRPVASTAVRGSRDGARVGIPARHGAGPGRQPRGTTATSPWTRSGAHPFTGTTISSAT